MATQPRPSTPHRDLGNGSNCPTFTNLLARLFSEETLSHLTVQSCLVSAILAVLLIATEQEEFGIPECTTTIEAAGLDGPHRWGIILPNSSRVSLLTYKAIVAVRYPELVLHDQDPIQIGHFVSHDYTVGQGGFRTVLWEVPRYSRDLLFFSVQRRMASARSFNMFPSMLHVRLIN